MTNGVVDQNFNFYLVLSELGFERFVKFYMVWHYRVFLVSLCRTRQLYRKEKLHPPWLPVIAAVLRRAIKETQSVTQF